MVVLQETRLYKILSCTDWETAQTLGYTKTALDEGDGYVHLSTRAQVAETLTIHYPGQSDVRLLEYVAEHMGQPIRWEESRGGQLFPHLYGTLRLEDARRTWTLTMDANSHQILPDDIDL